MFHILLWFDLEFFTSLLFKRIGGGGLQEIGRKRLSDEGQKLCMEPRAAAIGSLQLPAQAQRVSVAIQPRAWDCAPCTSSAREQICFIASLSFVLCVVALYFLSVLDSAMSRRPRRHQTTLHAWGVWPLFYTGDLLWRLSLN